MDRNLTYQKGREGQKQKMLSNYGTGGNCSELPTLEIYLTIPNLGIPRDSLLCQIIESISLLLIIMISIYLFKLLRGKRSLIFINNYFTLKY